jgi:hypothetical protein
MFNTHARVRLLSRGVALVACLVTVAACSGSTPAADTSSITVATTVGPTVSTPNTGSAAASSALPTTAPTSTVTVPATSRLQTAVAARADKYHFRSVVTVNGVVTLTAEGDRIGSSSRLDLVSKGATVSYIITPAGSWAQPEGGDWSKVDASATTADPLAALRRPSKVVSVSQHGDVDQLKVTVPATALGVGTSGTADVVVTITKGALVRVDYTSATAAGSATVTNQLGVVADATPITAPK